ncbi:hypothetical protein ASG87_00415 [Frateuria sp. Soil773]|uniref:hypothetical protein n=1 Tax=Frateuria sp. Soil773 TaxID=1736407 RepID=UPI0006F48F60|nr:hypothetical protein [Frateuria sp. Soil773]KRE92420.1 hypothetical protein ASG87_00415 [Frateuria sp. Soil773]
MAKRPKLRTLLWIALVFGLVWAGMIVYWRSTYRIPNAADVAVWFVGLPLALVVGFVGLRSGIDWLKRPRPSPSAAGDAVPATAEAADPTLSFTLSLLDSRLRLPAGETPEEVADAALANRRPGLHPSLRDARGLPVYAASVDAVAPDAFEDTSTEPFDGWQDEHKRSLLLAAEIAAELLERHAAPADDETPEPTAPIAIQLLLPERWSEAVRTAAVAWFGHRLVSEGWRAPAISLHAVAVADGVQALARIDELNLLLNRNGADSRHLLLACDSQVGETAVAALASARRLMGNEQPEGLIPGEGACGLLLARGPASPALPAARLHRLLAGLREHSADAAGRPRIDTVVHLLEQAQQQAGPDATPACVVSDADHRASRVTEITEAIAAAHPDLDPTGQGLHLGMAGGDSGAVAILAALAVAAQRSLAGQQPSLVVSVREPHARAVVLVGPPHDDDAVQGKAA